MADSVSNPRDGYAKAQAIATIIATVVTMLAALAVPIIVALLGHEYNDNLKARDARLRTTELAIAVLQEDPKNAPETPRLREWAVNVVDAFSGIRFPEGVREELQQNRLVAPVQPKETFRDRLNSHIYDLYRRLDSRGINAPGCAAILSGSEFQPYIDKAVADVDEDSLVLLEDLRAACTHYYGMSGDY